MNILVTGTGRSGTQYMGALLRHLGINIAHEKIIHNRDQEQQKTHDGETSWVAAPYLGSLPQHISIWHQLRDPVKTIGCYHQHKLLDLGDVSIKVKSHLPEVYETEDLLLKSIRFVLRWTQMISNMDHRSNYFRYRVEEDTPEALRSRLTASGYDFDLDAVEKAVDVTETNTGSCGGHHQVESWEQILDYDEGRELQDLYRVYGYACRS